MTSRYPVGHNVSENRNMGHNVTIGMLEQEYFKARLLHSRIHKGKYIMTKLICTFLVAAFAMLSSGSAYCDQGDINFKDLGFSDAETKPTPELQKTLDDRRFYLRQHQIWGLVSVGAMAAAFLSGGEGDLPPEHPFFAGLAVASYSAAAYTALMAPELPHGKEKGGTAWHRRLVWVHLPGMILTPILGYLAAKKIDKGEKLDGPEKYHKDVATITAATVAISALTVSFEF